MPTTPAGGVWPVHVVPPSVVARMSAPPDVFDPTAKQSEAEGQATLLPCGIAGYEALTCQPSGAGGTVEPAVPAVPVCTTVLSTIAPSTAPAISQNRCRRPIAGPLVSGSSTAAARRSWYHR